MKTATTTALYEAVASVDDPEFPGVSIADLGMLLDATLLNGVADVQLIPTFLGCPALGVIEEDVCTAALSVAGVSEVNVSFAASPVWSPDRVSDVGKAKLAEAFTVSVKVGGAAACPVCGAVSVTEKSPFGPTACRSIAYCDDCRNPVEVLRP